MSDNVFHVNDDAFENDVLKSDVPVLVDFYADWCGPCKMLAPIVEEVSEEYAGKVKFVKVNVDDSAEAAKKYGVRGIPTLIVFKEGNVMATKVGAMTKSQLSAFIDGNI